MGNKQKNFRILNWIFSVFCLFGFLAYFGSFSGFLFLIVGIFSSPIGPIKKLFDFDLPASLAKYIGSAKNLRIALFALLFVVGLFSVPRPVDAGPDSSVSQPLSTAAATAAPTPIATASPTPKPTPSPEPTTEPTPAPTEAPSPAAAPVEQPVSVTVYVTNTGAKYHAAGCQYLRKSQVPISLDDAKAQGYTPCSKCHPPQ
ncbi:hypothetical protein H8S23_05260 [Anaerofilum sp. BX8]|uniref:Ada DNA repair metal-binding domain-containing protein n=1 Tax=Anaerofilum hominis TaxID=2763016 RepID=A0A923I5X6_9FIRM|nr:hypothetical protein [Anaerofilum hominis]MBC5580906.1 hypothetical protein [Anaerofilum hominis]